MKDANELAGVLRDEPMARHTSWHVGGPADIYFKPRDVGALERFLASLSPEMPLHVVGLGSNLLVRDGGVRGVVISTAGLPVEIERVDDTRVRVTAGVPCARFSRRCVQWQLGPSAFFSGIPGSIGGALAMNAGAHGSQTWECVESVETFDRQGRLRQRSPADFQVAYRTVIGPADEWFVAATFQLQADPTLGPDAIKQILARRAATQPLGAKCCGSVFRNPPDNFAGRLIEETGLKGLRVGAASVSEMHANFIINEGDASAADIEELIDTVRKRVAQRTGVELQLEARVIGETGAPS